MMFFSVFSDTPFGAQVTGYVLHILTYNSTSSGAIVTKIGEHSKQNTAIIFVIGPESVGARLQ